MSHRLQNSRRRDCRCRSSRQTFEIHHVRGKPAIEILVSVKGKLQTKIQLTSPRQAVMKEAMRLHPSICFPLERVVPAEGANICGFDLPKGTIVGVLAPLVNRSKVVFGQDAGTFRPERWLEVGTERFKMMERTFTTVISRLEIPTSWI